jgi:oligoendopeptidase F
VLCSIGEKQEQLGARVNMVAPQKQFAYSDPQASPAGFTSEEGGRTPSLQSFRDGGDHRRFTGPLGPLKGHEHAFSILRAVVPRCAMIRIMSSALQIPPPTVRWDLSDLYSDINDPRIDQTWERVKSSAEAFGTRYRGKINSGEISSQLMAQAIRELEDLVQDAAKPVNFAQLMFVTDTGNPAMGAFMQKQLEKSTETSVALMFFELELQALPQETVDRLLEADELANYRHYVTVTRSFSPYRLSEAEEIILEETANTGGRAWVRYFEETMANQVYEYFAPGSAEGEKLNQEQVLSKLRDPARDVRQAAADAFTKGLKQLDKSIVFTYNNLLQDKNVEDRLRKMPYPEHSRHLSNELDQETVDLVVSMCTENYGLVERFYRVKRDILGLPQLTHIDRYAPLFAAEEPLDWAQAKRIVLDAFGEFSQVARDRADEFFEKGWIDAEPRSGKQGGAFCAYVTPDTHPFVLMNYLNKIDDVMTLAHELGHGVHASLSREQSYFNFHGTLPLAELASTFGEMLVFEKVVASATLKDKLALYASKIEGVFATVFRQAALYRFEQRCHQTRRKDGELTPDQFGELWQEEIQAMFRSSVQLGEQHRHWWSYIGHFFHAPFYVYAYSFGELLVLSLYRMAKEQGPSFADDYVNLLRQGGSKSPEDLMASVGIDLKSLAFWRGGFEAMEMLVSEFEKLWSEYSTTA